MCGVWVGGVTRLAFDHTTAPPLVPHSWTPVKQEPTAAIASCEALAGGVAHVLVVAARLRASAIPKTDASRQKLTVALTATPWPKKRRKKRKKKRKKKKGAQADTYAPGQPMEPVEEANTLVVSPLCDQDVVRVVSEAGGRSKAGKFSGVCSWGQYVHTTDPRQHSQRASACLPACVRVVSTRDPCLRLMCTCVRRWGRAATATQRSSSCPLLRCQPTSTEPR